MNADGSPPTALGHTGSIALRNLVAAVLAASAGVHAALAPEHLREAPRLGVAFVAAALLLLVLAAALVRARRPRNPAVLAAGALAVLVAAYVASRTSGLPLLGEHDEPFDALGLETQAVQLVGLVAALRLCQSVGRRRAARAMKGPDMSLAKRFGARRLQLSAIALIALVSAAMVIATSGAGATHAEGVHSHAAHAHTPAAHDTARAHALTARQAAFHDAMRKLWEDHITWTRLAIVSFAGGLPDLQATEDRLLANQADIGNAIRPYYGRAAAKQLTGLLRGHILGAVTLLQAAKSGDQAQIGEASTAWYANGRQIADFLHSANRRNWPRGVLRSMMKTHLDETLSEAQHRLAGNYAQDVRDYDAIHRHILVMADALSSGIMKQFPSRFR